MAQQPIAPAPLQRRRIPVLGLVLGGCAAIVVLGIGALVAGALFFALFFGSNSVACLPKDFPLYAGSHYRSENSMVSTNGNQCTATLDVSASSSDVTSYYQRQLDSAKWKTTGYNSETGVLSFTRTDNPKAKGTVIIVARTRTRTQVDILYDY